MNTITIFIISFIALAVIALAYSLILNISNNYKFGQQRIDSFLRRVNSLPFSLFLKKQEIHQQDYINHHQTYDIEKQVQTCETCQFHLNEECVSELQKTENIENLIHHSVLNLCPNQNNFKQYKNTIKNQSE